MLEKENYFDALERGRSDYSIDSRDFILEDRITSNLQVFNPEELKNLLGEDHVIRIMARADVLRAQVMRPGEEVVLAAA